MKKQLAVASAALLALGLAAPPAVAAYPAVAPGVSSAAKSDYSKKKQNRFWRVVTAYDPMVKYAGKRTTIDLGISTCDFLRAGADLYDLAALLLESDAGIAEDSAMAVMAAAPVILCPDQQYKFD